MSDTYWTGYSVNSSLEAVTNYVEQTLNGVSPDRIVSVTHAMSLAPSGSIPAFYSVMIVLKRAS